MLKAKVEESSHCLSSPDEIQEGFRNRIMGVRERERERARERN